MTRRSHRSLLALSAIALWGGCGGGSPIEVNPGPGAITILPGPRITVRSNDVVPLAVVVVDRNGDQVPGQAVTFTTSNATVATVGADYVLTADTPGTAILTARVGDVSAKLTVEVLAWPRTVVGGTAFGAAARGGVALVTTLDGRVLRLDATSGAVLATYNYSSAYAAFSDDGTRAFFGNIVFDLAAERELHALVANQSETCGDLSAARERPGGGVTYLGCSVGVLVVNSATGAVINAVPTSFPVNALALHPTDPRIYASAPTAGRVYEIGTQSNALVRELPILGGPQGAVLPGGTEIDVAMEGERQIERWDLGGPEITDSLLLRPLPNGPGPFDLVQSSDGRRFLASLGSVVIELDRTTLTVMKTYWVRGRARRIAVANGRALVANEGGWIDLLPF